MTKGPGAAVKAASRPVAQASTRTRRTRSTPTRLRRMLMMILATTVMSWVAATILTLGRRETVVSVRDHTSPAFLHALEAHAVLSDADRAVWASFRSGEAQLIGPGQDYQDDITSAGQDLEQLAGLQASTGPTSRQLQTVNGQLVNYQGLVEQGDATYRTGVGSASGTGSGHELGYAYLAYASKSLRDPQGGLLARIDDVAAVNRRTLAEQEAAPWTSPWLLLAYGTVALLTLGSLVYTQRFLRGRFRRTLSPPLAIAGALVLGISMWLGVVSLRADHGFRAAHDVAVARLSGIWHAQTRRVDANAKALREGDPGSSHDASSPAATTRALRNGLDVGATQPARRELNSAMAAAASTGGLEIAFPLAAAAIAGLAFFALKRRLDEYRG